MGDRKDKPVRVWLNGSELSRHLSACVLTAGKDEVTAQVEWLDDDSIEFDPLLPCARGERVNMRLQFGSSAPCELVGKLASVDRSKRAGELHSCKAVFEGEPL